MVECLFCDRCKKEISSIEDELNYEVRFYKNMWHGREKVDLCKGCSREFAIWFSSFLKEALAQGDSK